MVYVTGDTHGDKNCFLAPAMKKLKKHDSLIICGDFGFIWDGTKEEQKTLKWLSKRKYIVAFVEGTHENFDLLEQYPIIDMWNGKVRHICGNIYMLLKGEIYTIENNSFMCFGGGIVDEYSDILENNETNCGLGATEQEVEHAKAKLAEYNWKVDYIITHDIPSKLKSFILIGSEYNYILNSFLDEMYSKCKYRRWFFGCYHLDKIVTPQVTGVFSKVITLDK